MCRVTESDNYDQLLDRAMAGITKPGSTGERFELPIASVSVIGARTIVHNFADVADRLDRDPLQILKYLAKEMATAGSFEGGKGYFQGKFSRETINRLIGAYSNRFVICPVCHRPDTRLSVATGCPSSCARRAARGPRFSQRRGLTSWASSMPGHTKRKRARW